MSFVITSSIDTKEKKCFRLNRFRSYLNVGIKVHMFGGDRKPRRMHNRTKDICHTALLFTVIIINYRNDG